MSKYTEEELNRTLADTSQLLGDTPVSEEFSLDDILAEFGMGASARPAAGEPEKAQPEAPPAKAAPAAEEPAAEKPPAEEPAGDKPVQNEPAEEPDAKERLVSVEDVMGRTVSAVMEEESAQRQQEREEQEREERRRRRAALRRARLAAAKQLLRSLAEKKAPDDGEDDEVDSDDLSDLDDAPPPVEEPSMDDAEFEQKRLCRRHRRAALRCCIPAVLLAGVTVAEECFALPEMWTQGAYLRFGVVGGLLLVQALLALPLWRDMIENLQKKRFTCAWGALLLTLACLGDCAWCLLRGGAHLPLAGAAALVVFFCQWGVYLRCAARRESFRLADLGGNPPWGVEKTEAGAMKQRGRPEGFYTHTMTPDLPEKWQNSVLPLLLATACVLTGVVCLSGYAPGVAAGGGAALVFPQPAAEPQRLRRGGLLRRKGHQRRKTHCYHGRRPVPRRNPDPQRHEDLRRGAGACAELRGDGGAGGGQPGAAHTGAAPLGSRRPRRTAGRLPLV